MIWLVIFEKKGLACRMVRIDAINDRTSSDSSGTLYV